MSTYLQMPTEGNKLTHPCLYFDLICNIDGVTHPPAAVVAMSPDFIARLLTLRSICRKLRVYCVQEFDLHAHYGAMKGSGVKDSTLALDPDYRTQGELLCVYEDSFKFEHFIKHTDIEVRTATSYFSELALPEFR